MQGPVFLPITTVGEGEWSREPGSQVSLLCDSGCQCTGVATVSGVEARVAGTFETGGIELQDPHIAAVQCLWPWTPLWLGGWSHLHTLP